MLVEFLSKLKKLFKIILLLLVYDLEFIVLEISVKEIAKILEKIRKIAFKWREKNLITYDKAKIELVLFFYIY